MRGHLAVRLCREDPRHQPVTVNPPKYLNSVRATSDDQLPCCLNHIHLSHPFKLHVLFVHKATMKESKSRDNKNRHISTLRKLAIHRNCSSLFLERLQRSDALSCASAPERTGQRSPRSPTWQGTATGPAWRNAPYRDRHRRKAAIDTGGRRGRRARGSPRRLRWVTRRTGAEDANCLRFDRLRRASDLTNFRSDQPNFSADRQRPDPGRTNFSSN